MRAESTRPSASSSVPGTARCSPNVVVAGAVPAGSLLSATAAPAAPAPAAPAPPALLAAPVNENVTVPKRTRASRFCGKLATPTPAAIASSTASTCLNSSQASGISCRATILTTRRAITTSVELSFNASSTSEDSLLRSVICLSLRAAFASR